MADASKDGRVDTSRGRLLPFFQTHTLAYGEIPKDVGAKRIVGAVQPQGTHEP